MYKTLLVEYANPTNLHDTMVVPYRLNNLGITQRWAKILLESAATYPIDHPDRFYGFNTVEQQTAGVLQRIDNCITCINGHEPIVERRLDNVNDQDTLNYLHHIFEVYHGLLDQQTHKFYLTASSDVQRALADLNILVHECEDLIRYGNPRHVVTWYGMPKTHVLDVDDYQYFTDELKFGTVYLNYAEIGKTLEALAHDNDTYIDPAAFQPFRHYSADFNIEFFTRTQEQISERRAIINAYYTEHYQFFQSRGLYREHPYLRSGFIPLAEIDYAGDVIKDIQQRQYVLSVTIT